MGPAAGGAGQAQTVTNHEWDNPKSQGIIVRPHLEQQIQLWDLQHQKDES